MNDCKKCFRRFSETNMRVIDGEKVYTEHTLCNACQGIEREAVRRTAIEVERLQFLGHGKKRKALVVIGSVGITQRAPIQEPVYEHATLNMMRHGIEKGTLVARIG